MFDDNRTTQQRFHYRIDIYKQKKQPVWKHHCWWFIHNCIAHVAIGILPCQLTFALHDYTSNKINIPV